MKNIVLVLISQVFVFVLSFLAAWLQVKSIDSGTFLLSLYFMIGLDVLILIALGWIYALLKLAGYSFWN